MKGNRRKNKGFTLIELLIVVAIIAILAAIAVPNFLEAQVRAKVSRVHSDLRSLATAQEAYAVDYNTYTFKDQGDDPTYVGGYRLLTSPVAYITTVPNDPFGYHKWPGNDSFRDPMYEMGCGNSRTKESTGKINSPNRQGFPANVWMMVSAGPDKIDDTSSISGFNLTEGQFPWRNLPDNQAAVAAVLGLSYNATNGTRSSGQIYRAAGSKPDGAPYDVLFAGSVSQ